MQGVRPAQPQTNHHAIAICSLAGRPVVLQFCNARSARMTRLVISAGCCGVWRAACEALPSCHLYSNCLELLCILRPGCCFSSSSLPLAVAYAPATPSPRHCIPVSHLTRKPQDNALGARIIVAVRILAAAYS